MKPINIAYPCLITIQPIGSMLTINANIYKEVVSEFHYMPH